MSSKGNFDVFIRLSTSLAATFGAYITYRLLQYFYGLWSSPFRLLHAPPKPSLFAGHYPQLWHNTPDGPPITEEWVNKYGNTFAVQALLGNLQLFTMDVKAINHVLMANFIYEKPEVSRYNLSRVLGEGVLVTEGEKHKNQRKVMNPAFGPAQIRELTTIFVDKSVELRDIWTETVPKDGTAANIDVLAWLNRMTLDVIGLAGFNYKFNALSDGETKSELASAFTRLFANNAALTIIPILRAAFPWLRWLPAGNNARSKNARETMDRIGRELLENSKRELRESGGIDNNVVGGKNLLTLLLHANTSTDIPEHQRMSDKDVLSQVPTFIVAGHETTSTATAWTLFSLSRNPKVQKKLRDELLQIQGDNISMDELNSLPYLDAVIRESLRLHSPVGNTSRIAVKDDVIPFSTPVIDKYGKKHDSLLIRKGQFIVIPIFTLNRSKLIWGEDSHEFRPERWEDVPAAAASIPGVWSNILSFLGGPRACIGYRFTIVEMKAILFILIRKYEFELAVPASDVGRKPTIVQRPFLLSEPQAGNQMPMKVRLYTGEASK